MAKKFDLSTVIGFEWDKGNKEKNKIKHNVEISESEEVFLNNPIIMPDRTHSVQEERYFAFGVTDNNRELIVAFTFRGKNKEIVRPIMVRDQNKKERLYYHNEKLKKEVKKHDKTKEK